jgi:segregation and condensation protein B
LSSDATGDAGTAGLPDGQDGQLGAGHSDGPDGQDALGAPEEAGIPDDLTGPDILDAPAGPEGENATQGQEVPRGPRDAAEADDAGQADDAGDAGQADEAEEAGQADDGPGLRASLEAILLVADEPVPEVLLAQVLERPRHEVAASLRALSAEYTSDGRGFDLREIAGGWRFYTREDCAPLVERFVRDGQEVRLTQAALETLAVIAYRQPVSRARVSAVRGVNCDGVIRTLVLRGLVEDSGTDPETGAILYRTTGYFLERLGMASLDDLPDLAPFLPENIEDIEDNERTRA